MACAILVCGKCGTWPWRQLEVERGRGIAVPCHGQDTAAVILFQSYKLAHPCPSMISSTLLQRSLCDYHSLLLSLAFLRATSPITPNSNHAREIVEQTTGNVLLRTQQFVSFSLSFSLPPFLAPPALSPTSYRLVLTPTLIWSCLYSIHAPACTRSSNRHPQPGELLVPGEIRRRTSPQQ